MATAQKFQALGAMLSDNTISASTDLTPPAGADAVMIQCLSQNVRYTIDGSTVPTASTGFLMVANTVYTLDVTPGVAIKVIEASASATVIYQWLIVAGAF